MKIHFRALACSEDWLEIFVLFRGGSERFLGRYCGVTAPGPVESPSGAIGVRIHLHTDDENVSSGFKGRYVFEVAKSVTGLYLNIYFMKKQFPLIYGSIYIIR